MSMSNTTENDLCLLFFNGTALSWDALTSLYVALHTADPGEAGSAVTSEATYGSYARVAVNRDNTGFTVSGSGVVNAALVQFPTCTSGTNTLTHFSIVTTSSGAGQIIVSGALSASLSVSTGVQPQFPASTLSGSAD